jgi:hypothetical protein
VRDAERLGWTFAAYAAYGTLVALIGESGLGLFASLWLLCIALSWIESKDEIVMTILLGPLALICSVFERRARSALASLFVYALNISWVTWLGYSSNVFFRRSTW